MTTAIGGSGEPGFGTTQTTAERNILWGKFEPMQRQSASTLTTITDAGSTPTTVIRPGNLLALNSSTGLVNMWDADDFTLPGVKDLYGVLGREFQSVDFSGTAVSRVPLVWINGNYKASQLLIQGLALVGHAQEYVARRKLHESGCRLDDDPMGHLAGYGNRQIIESAATTAVPESATGSLYVATGTASNFTLPTIKAGLRYRFFNAVDANMIITGSANIAAKNSITANTITFSTASNLFGAHAEVEARYTAAGTLKWFTSLFCTNTAVVA